MAFTLESPAYAQNGSIPSKYTCDGENISPPLKWSGVPEGTRSFALIFDDPDAPAKTWVHWVLYNIPGDRRELEERVPATDTLADGAMHGTTDFREKSYGGPCPPSGAHRYLMKLYALDTELELGPGASKQELLDAMEGHVLDRAELTANYTRKR